MKKLKVCRKLLRDLSAYDSRPLEKGLTANPIDYQHSTYSLRCCRDSNLLTFGLLVNVFELHCLNAACRYWVPALLTGKALLLIHLPPLSSPDLEQRSRRLGAKLVFSAVNLLLHLSERWQTYKCLFGLPVVFSCIGHDRQGYAEATEARTIQDLPRLHMPLMWGAGNWASKHLQLVCSLLRCNLVE